MDAENGFRIVVDGAEVFCANPKYPNGPKCATCAGMTDKGRCGRCDGAYSEYRKEETE